MPFVFIFFGALFIISGVRATDDDLFKLLKEDFGGEKPNFIPWFLAILLIGALGYVESIKPVSRALLALVVIVLFLSNGGFFQKFVEGVEAPAPSA